MIAAAFAKLGVRDGALMDAIAQRVARAGLLAYCASRDVVNFVWAFAKVVGLGGGQGADDRRSQPCFQLCLRPISGIATPGEGVL